ncbi:hypothetical protein AABB24_028128, partial [Solanum stoloniferum]
HFPSLPFLSLHVAAASSLPHYRRLRRAPLLLELVTPTRTDSRSRRGLRQGAPDSAAYFLLPLSFPFLFFSSLFAGPPAVAGEDQQRTPSLAVATPARTTTHQAAVATLAKARRPAARELNEANEAARMPRKLKF